MVLSPSKVASVVRTEAKCSVIVGGADPGMKILHEIQFRMARRRGCADFLLTVEVCAQSRTLLVPCWAELGQTNFWATKQFPYSSRLFGMTQRRGRCSAGGCRWIQLTSDCYQPVVRQKPLKALVCLFFFGGGAIREQAKCNDRVYSTPI